MADRVPGRVILAGGGPGAEDLITVRSLAGCWLRTSSLPTAVAPFTVQGVPVRPQPGRQLPASAFDPCGRGQGSRQRGDGYGEDGHGKA